VSWATETELGELQVIFEDISAGPSGWKAAHCPYCPSGHKKNLRASETSGWCVCWRCGIKGWLYGPPEDRSEREVAEVDLGIIPLPEGCESLEQDPLPRHLHGYVDYLINKRRVDVDTILDLGIVACTKGEHAGQVVVPVDVAGLQRGWVARSVIGKKYSTPTNFARHTLLFNQDALQKETSHPVALVEGVFDGLPWFPDAVASLGQPTDEHIEILARASRPVCVMLDADAQSNTEAVYRRLLMRGVDVRAARLPPGSDPGELSPEQFYGLLYDNYYLEW